MCAKSKIATEILSNGSVLILPRNEEDEKAADSYFRGLSGKQLYEALYERIEEEWLFESELNHGEMAIILDEVRKRLAAGDVVVAVEGDKLAAFEKALDTAVDAVFDYTNKAAALVRDKSSGSPLEPFGPIASDSYRHASQFLSKLHSHLYTIKYRKNNLARNGNKPIF